ncbi:Ecdysteroid kinase-like family [Microdochium nivale]|nr:Ecdysteroid kinase-like family [Microdochium nivale]
MKKIIESAAQVTVDFLRNALGSPTVNSFTAKRIGTGLVGECHRITLAYSDPGDSLPHTLILKIASQDPRSRASGLSLGIYENETRFYTEVAPQLTNMVDSIPKCYYGAFDNSTGVFTLLLEDAGADSTPGDDIVAATREQADLAIRELGRLHAALIMDSSDKGWLVREPPISPALLRQLFTSFSSRYKAQMDPRHYEICQKLVVGFRGLIEMLKEPGVCTMAITHGDYRLDNMLYLQNGRVMVVDWQCITAGPVLGDVAYFLGCALKTQDRRAWQQELLETYCQGIEAVAGEPVLTIEDCTRELRLNAFFGVIMAIVSSIQAGRTDRGDEMFMTMLVRHCELVCDLDALSILPAADDEDMTPLRPTVEDEQQHVPGPEKDWNESWYFDFVDREQGVAGWVRLGLLPNREGNWYQATLTRKGEPTIIVSDFQAPPPGDRLHIKTAGIDATHEVLEPLKQFRLTLQGTGHRHTQNAFYDESEPAAALGLDLEFGTDGVPYHYRITTRYEIPCLVTGTITLGDGSNISLSQVPGQRDHSFGVRDWWSMDWVWASFHMDNGTRYHATELRLPEVPRIGMGYAQRDGRACEIEHLACDEIKDKSGLVVSMTMRIKLLGSEEEILAKVVPVSHTAIRLPSSDTRVALFDRAWAEVELDNGEKGVGWFEWNHNPSI